MTSEKIKTQEEVVSLVKELKDQGKTVVAFNGAFDVLHFGHVNSLIKAREHGDVLIVLLNSDRSVKSYKGPTRPIVPESERANMLAALSCVDYVVIFDEINAKAILDKVKPDILCKGEDWGGSCIEREVVEKNGGKIAILEKQYASSNLIKTIKSDPLLIKKAKFFNFNLLAKDIKADIKVDQQLLSVLEKLVAADYKIIIFVDIGSDQLSEEEQLAICQKITDVFKSGNIPIAKIYFNFQSVEEGLAKYEEALIDKLSQAVQEFGVSLNDSWIIGDREIDVKVGREVNTKTIKLGDRMKNFGIEPNYYVSSFEEAVEKIINSI